MEFLLNTEKLISKQSNQRKIEETLLTEILFKRKGKKFISYYLRKFYENIFSFFVLK